MNNNFGTANRTGEELDTPLVVNWLSYGIHLLVITGHEVEKSSKGSERLVLQFEGSPEKDPDFKPSKESKNGGKTAKAALGIYITTDEAQDELMNRLALIAKHLGRTKEIDAAGGDATTLKEYLDAAVPMLYNADPAYFKLKGKEYTNKKGKVGVVCEVARYGFVKGAAFAGEAVLNADGAVVSVPPLAGTDSKTTLTFDKNNEFDYEPLQESSSAPDGGGAVAPDAPTNGAGKKLW